MTLKALVVEDEEDAVALLSKLICDYCPEITISGYATTVQQAVDSISFLKPDIVFLDVALGNEKSFDVFNYFPNPEFMVVFTTAYSEFAFEAYQKNAVHYMLKPYSISEMRKMVAKVTDMWFLNDMKSEKTITIIEENNQIILSIKDICHLEADRAYCKIFMISGQVYIASRSMASIEKDIASFRFMRVHNSFIVNTDCIKGIAKGAENLILNTGGEVPIARSRKEEVKKRLGLM